MIYNIYSSVGIILAFMSYDKLFRMRDSAFQQTSSLQVHGPPGGSSLTKISLHLKHRVLLRPRQLEQ